MQVVRIVYNLAALILNGTSYSQQFMKSILSVEHMIVLVHSGSVAILWAYAPRIDLS